MLPEKFHPGINASGPLFAASVAFLLAALPAAATPTITTQPGGATVATAASTMLTVQAQGATTAQWRRNGINLPGANGFSLTLLNFKVADAGVYTVLLSDASGSIESKGAIVGVSSTAKVSGTGSEVGANIVHPNGNVYDQILLTGPAATITADPGQVTRVSFIDSNDDIVQVEFGGAGSLTLTLDGATGPAAPVKYNQPGAAYMKGHASLVIAGANATTNVSAFSVGRITAVNQALFRDGETYDGFANLALIAISSLDGKFGGIRAANTALLGLAGMTGVYAPGVAMLGPVFLGDVTADSSCEPVMIFGSTTDVRITGGTLQQFNARPVQVDGIARIDFTDGSTSGGQLVPAHASLGQLQRNGVNVTAQLLDSTPVVISQIAPAYPFAMKAAGISGDVTIQFIVEKTGSVSEVVVLSSSRVEFEATSVYAVSQWLFKPGRKNGIPVRTRMQIPIYFSLN